MTEIGGGAADADETGRPGNASDADKAGRPGNTPNADETGRPDNAPDVDEVRRPGNAPDADKAAHPVDRRTIPVWRWSAAFGSIFPLAAGTLLTLSLTVAGEPVAPLAWAALLALIGVLAARIFWHPPARYRRLRYRVDAIGITIRDGIFWRKETALPRVRIQHTDISQGPLQRRYGVATLKLYTAGSRFTLTELPGLAYDDAVALRDRLIESGLGGPGDAV